MKISIDVLPDEQKEKRNQEKRIASIFKIGTSFVLALLVLNAVFFLMQIVLNIEYQAAKKSSESSSEKNSHQEERMENGFREVGRQVLALSKIKSEIPNWARVLVIASQS